jgi:Zn-dependent protease with chaperone function
MWMSLGWLSLGLTAMLAGYPDDSSLDPIRAYVGSALSPFNRGNYAGYKRPLEGAVAQRFAPLAARADAESPVAIFIAEPPVDSQGRPKAQLALSCGFVSRLQGHDYDVIFLTQYLKEGLTDGELLAVLAHEAAHFQQMREYRRQHPDDMALKHFHFSRGLEAQADAWALGAPEVDPRDFKGMIQQADRLNDEATKRHPGLVKSGLGTTKLIPYSVQTRLELGWDHPTSGSRIKTAETEMARRGLSER